MAGWSVTRAHPLLGPIYSIKPPQYDIEDYIAEIRFSNVPKAIHVEAAVGTPDPVDETDWLRPWPTSTATRRASSPRSTSSARTPRR